MFRDLYEKYADKIIIDTISGLIQEAGDYESDWWTNSTLKGGIFGFRFCDLAYYVGS